MSVLMAPIELTGFTKSGGPLTKRISLAPDGKPQSDGSACVMGVGKAVRVPLKNLTEFAACIGSLEPHEAIALGALRAGLPEQVEIVTKSRLQELNGSAAPNTIARMAGEICYRPKQSALALLDYDTKGMPAEVGARINSLGGFWGVVTQVVPELANTAHVMRCSTSAGLYRTDTGEVFEGSNGVHVFLLVADGSDVERFLKALHARCWLVGLGWHMVGAAGQLLERSIVDRMVGAPERLVFEGAPVLIPPLAQDQESRKPTVHEGEALDTVAACPPLSILEQARLKEVLAKSAHQLQPERARAFEAFVKEHTAKYTRAGKPEGFARLLSLRFVKGILLPDVSLPMDDPDLSATTVRDVLAHSAKYEGETLADPLEGVSYGRCKAKIMRRADGTPWIHSFAHGRSIYELKLDAAGVRAAIEKATKDQAASVFVQLALQAELADDELEDLRNLTANRAGVGKRAIDRKLKAGKQEQRRAQAEEERNRCAAERTDPRPQLQAPGPDAPWLPQMQALNEVLSASRELEPPARDIDGAMTGVRVRCASTMHALTTAGANDGEAQESRLPAPEQPLLTRLDELQLAELIERHIEHVNENGIPVHLGMPFVRQFLIRSDRALPTVTAVATLPIVLADGTILSGAGLDRKRGIVFRVPSELQRLLPKPESCTTEHVVAAMRFLTDEWLLDVATDYAGKCVLIAAAMTILERLVMAERPAFFVTAGQRGGGKTTVLNMIAIAALGKRAAAAAWSSSEEERRKALFSYLGDGVPFLVWDNMPRGAQVSCPSIEKALTAETYSDRVLGESTTRTVPAYAVQAFTGNNIAPRGDMASRSLSARLAVDRPDPENREFRHSDPIEWTDRKRGHILSALYVILLGNPRLQEKHPAPAETRFKAWWHLVGSAIEHAAAAHAERVQGLTVDAVEGCRPVKISFRKLFLSGEAEEEQSASLATVLETLRDKWPAGFKAADAAFYAGSADERAIAFKGALEVATGKALPSVSSVSVAWRLKAMADAPVQVDGRVLVLRYAADAHGGNFAVREVR